MVRLEFELGIGVGRGPVPGGNINAATSEDGVVGQAFASGSGASGDNAHDNNPAANVDQDEGTNGTENS